MMKKIKIGIDINEILRALWFKFDYMYYKEFSNEKIPNETPYTYDFFKNYLWEDVEEETAYLREDAPDDINPLDYKIDPETGEAPADFLLFKKENKKLTAKEVYNRFMYEDYLFEIFGGAPVMYKNADVDVNKFMKRYNNNVNFIALSKENELSIPPTLFFLSKNMFRFREIHFVDDVNDYWNLVDILITTDPKLIDNGTPEDKKLIKLIRPYNENTQDGDISKEILQLNDLIGLPEFEEMIGFPSDKTLENIEKNNKEEIKIEEK